MSSHIQTEEFTVSVRMMHWMPDKKIKLLLSGKQEFMIILAASIYHTHRKNGTKTTAAVITATMQLIK